MSDVDAILEARARAGQAIRDIGHAFIGRHATLEQIERLATVLEGIGAELWPADPRSRDQHPFAERQLEDYPQGRFEPRFDDRPVSGRSSPWGLDLRLHRHGDEIDARVTLRSAHEGAPNRSHGGIVAALFDDVYGFVLALLAQPGFTGELGIRYVAGVPIGVPLECRVRMDRQEGRKLYMTGELRDGDTVVARSTATFITIPRELFYRAQEG